MTSTPEPVPVIAGWFSTGDEPTLTGSQCRECRSYFFPKQLFFCKNPRCTSRELDEVALSRRGRIWSYTDNRFAPPPPYVAGDPFEPYAVAAVELELEQMVVMGQLTRGVDTDALHVGMEVELVVEVLDVSDGVEHLVWKWRPVASTHASGAIAPGGNPS